MIQLCCDQCKRNGDKQQILEEPRCRRAVPATQRQQLPDKANTDVNERHIQAEQRNQACPALPFPGHSQGTESSTDQGGGDGDAEKPHAGNQMAEPVPLTLPFTLQRDREQQQHQQQQQGAGLTQQLQATQRLQGQHQREQGRFSQRNTGALDWGPYQAAPSSSMPAQK